MNENGGLMSEEIILGDACDEAKATIRGKRQDEYGHPEDSFKLIAYFWTGYLKTIVDSPHFKITPLDVAHMMSLFKHARMIGQAPKRDNYIDSIGYLAIAADRIITEPK